MIGVLGRLCLYGHLSRSPGQRYDKSRALMHDRTLPMAARQCPGQRYDKSRALMLYTLYRDLPSMRHHNFLHSTYSGPQIVAKQGPCRL
jgi:hypothetical protein